MKWRSNRVIKNLVIILYSSMVYILSLYFAFSFISGSGNFNLFYHKLRIYALLGYILLLIAFLVFDMFSCDLSSAGVSEFLKLFVITLIIFIYGLCYKLIRDRKDITIGFLIVSNAFASLSLAIGYFSKRIFFHFAFLSKKSKSTRVLIVGAGVASKMFLQEVLSSDKIMLNPVCLVDDDPSKLGMRLEGVKVVGNTQNINAVVEKYKIDLIVIAMPSVPKQQIVPIYNRCVETKCKVKQVPGLYQFISGKVSLSQIQEVDLRDLLGREQIVANVDQISSYVTDKVILVTGGGGSIGSELCRQLATVSPKQLIVFDICENGAYNLQQELIKKHPELDLIVLIGSVRDKGKLDSIFSKYRPQLVFHAAAHKHVPLMEFSPNEAVKNNVFGTYNVATTADKYGVERFLLISTDKAVNPTNVMGATKRICEMIVQSLNKTSKTEFVAVRFGNVLGSSGSVIPLFKSQIASGGPVTVTSKEITRYFMTIPEAVSLVLQAGVYAKGGEIFVLDMGEPVKIYDMAVNLIKLSGYEPDKDIKIEISGLRPGEKLYEERLMSEEGLERTENELISIGKPLVFDEEEFYKQLSKLYEEAYKENGLIKEEVAKIVTTYTITD